MDKKKYLDIRKKLSFEKKHYFLIEHICVDIILLGVFYTSTQINSILSYIIGQITLAFFFFRSFGVMHDAVHNAISPYKWVNTCAGYLYGTFCFLPFEAWKDIHMKHHFWASNIDKDPTYSLVKNYNPNKFLGNKIQSFIWKSWLPILGALQYLVFWKYNFTLIKHCRSKKLSIKFILTSIITSIGIYVALSVTLPEVINLANVAPAIFFYLTLVEIINFPHHLGLPVCEGKERLQYKDQYKVSRSCLYPRWFSRIILKNFNFHSEHHLYPDLPWHQLDEAHKLLRNELHPEANFIHGNRWILENRKVSLDELLAPNLKHQKNFSKAG